MARELNLRFPTYLHPDWTVFSTFWMPCKITCKFAEALGCLLHSLRFLAC